MSKIRKFDDFSIGQKYSKSFQMNEKQVNDFADLVGDKNPIHIDKIYASKSLFGKRIVHGAFIYGLISSILGMNFPGKGTILVLSKN